MPLKPVQEALRKDLERRAHAHLPLALELEHQEIEDEPEELLAFVKKPVQEPPKT